jgi:hypothetical protein
MEIHFKFFLFATTVFFLDLIQIVFYLFSLILGKILCIFSASQFIISIIIFLYLIYFSLLKNIYKCLRIYSKLFFYMYLFELPPTNQVSPCGCFFHEGK